ITSLSWRLLQRLATLFFLFGSGPATTFIWPLTNPIACSLSQCSSMTKIHPRHDLRPQEKASERELRQTIGYLRRDIETLTLQLKRSQQLTHNIVNYLEAWSSDNYSLPVDAESDLRRLKHLLMAGRRLEKLSADFEQVNAAFYHRLLTKCPTLTQLDLELCAYARMGLTKKEVAVLRGVAPGSVKRQYSRMRKRLGLGASEKLAPFLTGVG
ncbi:MAG: hypothetical protein AAF597_15645, partial [Bacteroidota bacterium]